MTGAHPTQLGGLRATFASTAIRRGNNHSGANTTRQHPQQGFAPRWSHQMGNTHGWQQNDGTPHRRSKCTGPLQTSEQRSPRRRGRHTLTQAPRLLGRAEMARNRSERAAAGRRARDGPPRQRQRTAPAGARREAARYEATE